MKAAVAEVDLRRMAALLRGARRVAVLTGAGISVPSGIPDFRSRDGLYADPENLGIFEIGEFLRRPERFFRFAARFYPLLLNARPNPAHREIARWEQFAEVAVITQNIDDLHEQAGSRRVYHLHGDYRTSRCLRCGRVRPTAELLEQIALGYVARCDCGGVMKPEIVFFGEMLPEAAWRAAEKAMAEADVVVVVGTSLAVYPAAMLPRLRNPAARVIVVNREPTVLDEEAAVTVRGDVADVFSGLQRLLAG